MDAYVKQGSFAYHTTMPTDALRDFHQVTVEVLSIGIDTLKERQWRLGQQVRDLFRNKYALRSVAATGYEAPGVLVFYSPGRNVIDNPKMMQMFQTTTNTTARPLQIAMGVPWKLNEPVGLKTFRIGLFGLDKLMDVKDVGNKAFADFCSVSLGQATTLALPTVLSADSGGALAPLLAARRDFELNLRLPRARGARMAGPPAAARR